MIIYFTISEFIIDPDADDVPVHVADKILNKHIPVLNPIRKKLGTPLHISKNSGYRSPQWELDHGRDGTSEHTFKGDGAVDLTCKTEAIKRLGDLLAQSEYHRVAWYPDNNFYHCDFKGESRITPLLYIVENGHWRQGDFR